MSMDIRETTIEHCEGDKWCTVSTAERKYVNRARELAKNYPDDIRIIENNDGSIYLRCPFSWFKFPKPPKKVSEEFKAAARERLKAYRKN